MTTKIIKCGWEWMPQPLLCKLTQVIIKRKTQWLLYTENRKKYKFTLYAM